MTVSVKNNPYNIRHIEESIITLDKINQSKALLTGNVSSDADVYADVLKYAHSTFDKSKFEIVGSPVITDDGIASGFSNNNHIKTIQIGQLKGHSFEIRGRWINQNITPSNTANTFFNFGTWTAWGSIIYTSSTKSIVVNRRSGVSSDTNNEGHFGNLVLQTTPDYIDYIYGFNIDKGEYYASVNYGNGWVSVGTDIPTTENKELYLINESPNNFIQIGNGSDNGFNKNATDLKQFNVYIDGQPIFNGSKTGLDVIKPDDYTVVGSPTITPDGIASGFSATNSINVKLDNPIPLDGVVTISGEVVYGGRSDKVQQIFDCVGLRSEIQTLGKVFAVFPPLGLIGGLTLTLPYVLTSGDILAYNITWNQSIKLLTIAVKLNSEELTPVTKTYTDTQTQTEITTLSISSTGYPFTGSIDLNLFKVIRNGNLVYQPCLKIPYTLSKTGSKIVDAAYRDRVQDVYEQTGEALFYTIDEQNQNFTLPASEIYGMITRNREILDIVYPIGRPMPEENNALLDNEVWLEGAAVNIVDYPKLFEIYGTKYGGDGTTTFQLPDLRNRVLWGSSDGSNGYVEAGLPNIEGNFLFGGDAGTHPQAASSYANGAFIFTGNSSGNTFENTGAGQTRVDGINFNASRSSSIYKNNTKTVQPPAFKVRFKTRFE